MARLLQSVNCQWISQESIPHRCLPFHSYRCDKSCHSSRENGPASKTRTKFGSVSFEGTPFSERLRACTCCRAKWRNLSIVNVRLDLFALYKKVARMRSISTYFQRRISLRRVHVLQIISARDWPMNFFVEHSHERE